MKVGLEGADAPLHLEMEVSTDLSKFPPLLEQMIKDKDIQKQIARLHQVSGRAKGRLVLGERVDDVRIGAEVTEFHLTASFKGIPSGEL